MSARRHRCVGYGEFRDRDMEIKVSRVVEHDRIMYRNRDYKGGEKRGIGCGYDKYRSDSGSSDGVGLWKRRDYGRVIDREPGELSSESGSDGGIVLDSQVKENEIKKIESGDLALGNGNKRKFLGIVGDGDDKEVSSMLKNRESNGVLTLSALSDSKDVCTRPSKVAKIQVSESTKLSLELDSCVSTRNSSPVDQTLAREQQPVYYDTKEGNAEDDEFVHLRNIKSSRWANDFDSPADEGEFFEDEVMPKLGELRREGSSVVRSKSSDSDERVWSSGRDSCSGHVTDTNDMEEDEDHHYDGSSANESDTELEDAPKVCSSPRRNVNMLHGCRSVDEFERLNKINEGTYGVVYKARDRKTGEIVALKKVKMEKEREGFPLTALREINILLSFDHSSIVDVKEIVVGSSFDDIFMVMEYMEHDLKGFLENRKQRFSESEVKSLMLQLLKGTKYLHDNWVLHRDLKTSNLLLNDKFDLKICDFGLARQYGSPLKPYTQLVVTLWYRAPELLLGSKQYSTAIDMWSIGCIMAELLSKGPLFNGKSELDQIDKIFRTLGAPNDSIWPGYSKLPGAKGNFAKHKNNMLRKKFPPSSFTGAPVLSDAGFDLLSKLLAYDPERRISAEAALEHEWFQEDPCSKDKEFPHTFFNVFEQDRRMRRVTKGPDTLEGQQWRELQRWGSSTGGVFG